MVKSETETLMSPEFLLIIALLLTVKQFSEGFVLWYRKDPLPLHLRCSASGGESCSPIAFFLLNELTAEMRSLLDCKCKYRL